MCNTNILSKLRVECITLLALMLCLGGCQGNGLTEVTGTVSYDGQPIKKGNISFWPSDGNGPTAAAIITDGRFAANVAPGKKLVRIEGFKVAGQQHYMNDPGAPLVDVQTQFLPECYNAKTEITCEIVPRNPPYDFPLRKR